MFEIWDVRFETTLVLAQEVLIADAKSVVVADLGFSLGGFGVSLCWSAVLVEALARAAFVACLTLDPAQWTPSLLAEALFRPDLLRSCVGCALAALAGSQGERLWRDGVCVAECCWHIHVTELRYFLRRWPGLLLQSSK